MCDKTCIFCFFPIINKYLCMAKRSLLSRCPSYIGRRYFLGSCGKIKLRISRKGTLNFRLTKKKLVKRRCGFMPQHSPPKYEILFSKTRLRNYDLLSQVRSITYRPEPSGQQRWRKTGRSDIRVEC